MSETKEKNHLQPDNETGLMDAVNQMFYSVLLVNPKEDSVLILQDHDCPETVQTRMNWTEYLERYSAILTEEERAKVWKRLSSHALLAAASGKETSFTLDVSCLNQKQNHTDWSTISAVIKQTGSSVSAYIFIRQSNEEHLLKSIINLYVYNTCDYFIYLNAQNNSYVMFSGSNNGTPLPPEICNDYASALVEYARNYVVPEDQEMVIREMQIDRVLEQLDLKVPVLQKAHPCPQGREEAVVLHQVKIQIFPVPGDGLVHVRNADAHVQRPEFHANTFFLFLLVCGSMPHRWSARL